jgi:hypothetical protein
MLGADTNRDKKDVKFTLIGRGYGVLAVVTY